MRVIILGFILAAFAFGQTSISTINNEAMSTARTKINDNFSSLNTNKAEISGTSAITIIKAAIGTALTDGLYLHNSEAATSGQAQNSPSLRLRAYGWNAAGAASESLDYYITAKPWKQSASGPSRANPGFEIGYKINGGTYATLFHMYNHPDGYDSDFSLPNYFLGLGAGNQTMSAGAMANFGLGNNVLTKITSGNENLGIGNSALYECTTCYWNAAIGNEAGIGLTTGYQNTFFGQDAGRGASLATAVTTGQQNLHMGIATGPASPGMGAIQKTVAIGYGASVYANFQGVIGGPSHTTKWSIGGGTTNPDRTLVVADESSLGSNIIDPITDADWDGYTDFSVAGDSCAYAHSSGSGTCKTFAANYNVTPIANRLYRMRITVSNQSGNPSCSLQGASADNQYLGHSSPTNATSPNGTWDVYFRWNSTAASDLMIYCTSDSVDDTVTFDDIEVKQVLEGDLDVNDDLTVGGDATVSGSVIGGYQGSVASAATLTLPVGNIFDVTGTTSITTLNTCNAANAGRRVTLIFADALTVTDGNNLKLAGDFTTTADDTITLVCNGTNWYEAGRSAN